MNTNKILFGFFLIILISVFVNSVFAQQESIWDRIPDAIKQSKAFKRTEWLVKQRAIPYDTVSAYTHQSELKKEMQKYSNSFFQSPNNLQWSSIGPDGINFTGGPYGGPPYWGRVSGRIRGLAIHPTNPDIVYIGAASGGIWKTINGGDSWMNIGDELPSLTYGAIAIDPNNPEIIYAGAGEFVATFYSLYAGSFEGDGLYKSTDGGQTWNQITNGFGGITQFGDLDVSPHNSNTVIAALGGGVWHRGDLTNEGIWLSTNAGENWTRTLVAGDASDVIFHPTDPNIVYAAAGDRLGTAGFHISTDAGLTWTKSNNGLQFSSEITRMQISLCDLNPSIIYATIFNFSSVSGDTALTRAYKTTDGGLNWNHISPGTWFGGIYPSINFIYDQGFYDLTVAVNPSNPDQVLIGNVELHQTSDGQNFNPVRISGSTNSSGCLVHVDIHKILFAPSNNNIVYLACDGGIYKSTNGGINWFHINNGITTMQIYRMASHKFNPDTLMIGMQDNGIGITYDRGSTPYQDLYGGDGMEVFFDHTDPNGMFVSIQNGNTAMSPNFGNTFQNQFNLSGAWITPYFMHPTNNQWVYAATDRIWRSTNRGQNWTTITNVVSPNSLINTMDQSSVNPDIMIFAGSYYTNFPAVKYSTDGGFNWHQRTNFGGLSRYISRVVCDPVDENTFYLVKSGYSPGNKIYKTTDLGENWTNISGDLPDIPHNDLFVDPETNNYYAANDFGVYSSTDEGVTWIREGNGMPFVVANDFDYVVHNDSGYLRIGTFGRSVFETNLGPISPTDVEDVEGEIIAFELNQNYPNPFNPITMIRYSIPEESFVKLEIINALGERINLLEDGIKSSGTYESVWNAEAMPSGIYFYRLQAVPIGKQAVDFVETKKMILLQ